MKKILSFSLGGKFAHFKFPFTSPNHLKKSYSIPPRTTILGLLGAIIGLKGFQDFNDILPEYYEKLRHIPISISLEKIPIKKLIRYNSLNSFADNSKKGENVIIQEEVILNPKYKILLQLEDNIKEDKMLLENITNRWIISNYHIYLGKNEFFAEIKNVEVFDENNFSFENAENCEKLVSVVPSKFIGFECISDEVSNGVLDSFSYDIDFTDKKLKTKYIEVFYFLKEEKENNLIKFKEKLKFLKLKDKYYFFFDNEIIKKL